MTHNTDAPDSTDNDSAYPYSLRNRKKNSITPKTDVPDDADNDSASPNSLILYSSLKRKIEPKSMLKLKN